MKLTIENKILIPFVLLFFISQVILLATSFRNDYNLIISNQYRNMDTSVEQLIRSMDYSFREGEVDVRDRQKILQMIESIMGEKIIVDWNGQTILNSSAYDLEVETLKQMGMSGKIAHLQNDDYLFSYYYYAPLGWSITVLEDKNALLSFFYESYKYNILTGIIFLTLSLQFTVFIAANITKPIKKLVRFCTSIGEGQKDQRILIKRKDEIGQLNTAFNNMLDQLDASMEELVQVKNYNQTVLNSIEKGIVTYDANGQLISMNPCAETIIDACKDFLYQGNSLLDTLVEIVNRGEKDGNAYYEQLKFENQVMGNKKYLDCYVSSMNADIEGIQGYICSFNDVTNRIKFEKDVQRLDRLATAGRLASGVAHEIRNPLTGMRMSLQVLKKRLGKDVELRSQEIIDRTIGEIDRINRLISDLLGYARPSHHMPTNVSVKESIYSIKSLLDVQLDKTSLVLTEHYQDEKVTFYIDGNHFHQIVLNILKNSIEAVGEGGKVDVKIDSGFERGTLTISDNGVGMSQTDIEKIYDPFFTLKNDGTGLGMSVVYELVQRNEGTINVQSRLGKGTVVIMTFKLGEWLSE